MKTSPFSELDARHDQMFPTLTDVEIEHLRNYGELRVFAVGAALSSAGEPDRGIAIVLEGDVTIVGRDERGQPQTIVTHRAGAIVGELAQLSGRPALVDAIAVTGVEAVMISVDGLHTLMVREAALGAKVMAALILRRVGLMETGLGGPVILGTEDDPEVRRIAGFLDRNGHPHRQLDPWRDPSATALVDRLGEAFASLPAVVFADGSIVRTPSLGEMARRLGILRAIDRDKLYDVAIVGAGPAGLATAVYAASEGLSVLVVEMESYGGQAGASARIENYLGFPTGISGVDLMTSALTQAQKFGAETAVPLRAEGVSLPRHGSFSLRLQDSAEVRSRSLIIATGASYRRPKVDGLARFESSCVHYWATPVEGRLCAGRDVVAVGGGNSAGQAVVYLAGQCRSVTLLVRAGDLAANMSSYLIDRISSLENVDIHLGAQLMGVDGPSDRLERVIWRNGETTSANREAAADHLFLFIGAQPNSEWLMRSGIALDAKGYVLTGAAAGASRDLETSLPGAFAIGDVRSGSVKRVAAAVGEGAQATRAVHGYLSELDEAARQLVRSMEGSR